MLIIFKILFLEIIFALNLLQPIKFKAKSPNKNKCPPLLIELFATQPKVINSFFFISGIVSYISLQPR